MNLISIKWKRMPKCGPHRFPRRFISMRRVANPMHPPSSDIDSGRNDDGDGATELEVKRAPNPHSIPSRAALECRLSPHAAVHVRET